MPSLNSIINGTKQNASLIFITAWSELLYVKAQTVTVKFNSQSLISRYYLYFQSLLALVPRFLWTGNMNAAWIGCKSLLSLWPSLSFSELGWRKALHHYWGNINDRTGMASSSWAHQAVMKNIFLWVTNFSAYSLNKLQVCAWGAFPSSFPVQKYSCTYEWKSVCMVWGMLRSQGKHLTNGSTATDLWL